MLLPYDTIAEFNVDWKAEYSALSSTRSQKKKLKQTTPVPFNTVQVKIRDLAGQSLRQRSQLQGIQKTTENIHVSTGLQHVVTFSLLFLVNTCTCLLIHCVQKKNTHSHFLSYLHELFVDLNKNCSEYTQGLVDSNNAKIRHSLRSMT